MFSCPKVSSTIHFYSSHTKETSLFYSLESICFAILIGISCDFVIHFGHAYNYLPGNTSRFERTKYAVIHMGPSILAAAFTTFAAATVMLFCKVTIFTKFALILLMTILHATLGSFVVYIVLADSFGPVY